MRIQIQLFISINADANPDEGAKPMRIHANPNHGQTLKSQKVEFLHEKYT
jgi:hypothetical protein